MYSSVDKRDVASSFPFSSEVERKMFLFHNQSHKIHSVPQFFTDSFAVDFRDHLVKVSFEVHFGIICGLRIICGTVHFTTDLPGTRSRVSTQMTHSDWSDLMVYQLPVGPPLCCWRPIRKRSNPIIPEYLLALPR